ncbi:MAG: hypothetical protein GW748_05450 [Alphaproteobacteria bacterium]|nr:hypothetical protein [Alphaproteobacteria bacterium]NCQ67170.1 hypothetical protein [Alphaproteobacteria bacterium]NCT07015.1 hypothetical protein [Alphaproteobacteria bacterium]
MPHKKNNPEKSDSQTKENKAGTPTQKDNPPSSSPRKTVNLFMVVLLLLIVGGIYLHQKGYITKYYPLVKSKFEGKSPIDATVDIPQQDPVNFSKTLAGNSKETENGAEPETTLPPQGSPSSSSDSYDSSLNIDGRAPSNPPQGETLKDLQERVATLEEKLLALSAAMQQTQNTSPPTELPAADNKLIFALSTLQDLQNRLDQGLSFTQELSSLKNLLTDEDYAILQEYAPIGVPNLPYLIKNFKGVERFLKQQETFKNSTTAVEKFLALLGQLIHIEKTTTNDQMYELTDIVSSYKIRLQNDDIEKVIAEIEAVSDKDETLALWLAHAKAYNRVQKIIRKTKQSLFQPNL